MSHLPNPPPEPTPPSSQPHSTRDTLLSHIDHLLEQYLTLLDQSDTARKQLSSSFSAGFLSLAQANFSAPSHIRRYGADHYDERMKAGRRVVVGEGEEVKEEGGKREDMVVRIVKREVSKRKKTKGKEDAEKDEAAEEKEGSTAGEEVPEDKTFTENPTDKQSQHNKEAQPTPKAAAEATKGSGEEEEVITDPLRMFGVLVPQALRTTQGHFSAAVDGPVPRLCELTRQMRNLESEIGRTRKQVKKLDSSKS